MGSVARRPDGRWRARYRDAARREHCKHFDRKIDAQKWLAVQAADILRGAWVDPAAGQVTFRAYAEQWRVAQEHRPATAPLTESMLRKWAYPTFGDRTLASIGASDVKAWVRRLSEQLAPSTVGVYHGILAGIFLSAVDDRRIVVSPCARRSRSGKGYLPERSRSQVVPMSTAQVLGIAAAMPGRCRALVILAAGTGLRQGECLGLTRDRVDLDRRTVRVDRQLVRVPGQGARFGPPKTRASYRTVPLPQVVKDELAAHLADYPPGEPGVLFTDEAGRPIRRSNLSTVWNRAAKDAGATGVPFHALRHYYASLLIFHGESVKVVQARLGHARAAETLDTYSHLWPDSDDQTRAAVDDVLGPRPVHAGR